MWKAANILTQKMIKYFKANGEIRDDVTTVHEKKL